LNYRPRTLASSTKTNFEFKEPESFGRLFDLKALFRNKKCPGSFDPELTWEILKFNLVTLNVQKLVQDGAENTRRSVVVCSVLEVAVVAFLVLAI
jgi:hypothetical protein